MPHQLSQTMSENINRQRHDIMALRVWVPSTDICWQKGNIPHTTSFFHLVYLQVLLSRFIQWDKDWNSYPWSLNYSVAFNSTQDNDPLGYQCSWDMRDQMGELLYPEGRGRHQAGREWMAWGFQALLGECTCFLSSEGFSDLGQHGTWGVAPVTWLLQHRHNLRSEMKGLRAQWLNSYHGNQRCFRSCLLQTKIENKHKFSIDGQRKDEGSEFQGPGIFKNVTLNSYAKRGGAKPSADLRPVVGGSTHLQAGHESPWSLRAHSKVQFH